MANEKFVWFYHMVVFISTLIFGYGYPFKMFFIV